MWSGTLGCADSQSIPFSSESRRLPRGLKLCLSRCWVCVPPTDVTQTQQDRMLRGQMSLLCQVSVALPRQLTRRADVAR